ncbi:MAG: aminoglycoside phosphotransferase family protein [Calditrichia bacterium]
MPAGIITPADFKKHLHSEVWGSVAQSICNRHGLSSPQLVRSKDGENVIFFVGENLILKIYGGFRDGFAREKAVLLSVQTASDTITPEICFEGDVDGWNYLMMTRLNGKLAKDVWPEVSFGNRIDIATELGLLLKQFHSQASSTTLPALYQDWQGFLRRQFKSCIDRQRENGANPEWLESLPEYMSDRIDLLDSKEKPVLLHGDIHLGNLMLIQNNGRWQISGLFDFGDAFHGNVEYDFVAPGVLMIQGNRELQRAFLLAYGYEESQLDAELRAKLMLLTILYECSNLRKYALRLAPEAVDFTLAELEAAIWRFF